MDKAIKITSLEAENVKRIRAVKVEPTAAGLAIIGGDNNQGKTSVLDALAWALGGDRFRPTQAAREGSASPPHLKVTLSNGITVERKGKNSALTVTDPSGNKAGQQLLNAFIEQFALDLPRFMQMSDREKADTLLQIIGVPRRRSALGRRARHCRTERMAPRAAAHHLSGNAVRFDRDGRLCNAQFREGRQVYADKGGLVAHCGAAYRSTEQMPG